MSQPWDYLVLTASNSGQAKAYGEQVRLRRNLGLLPEVRETLVISDPGGRRVGSGGSTLCCLADVVNRELERHGRTADEDAAADILRSLRILIVHAGGDSRRLPAYGPCGKIFLPLPGESQSALAPTLFDRLAPIVLALPAPPDGAGQVVVTSGDALILFDPATARMAGRGLTALGSYAAPEEAARHGVFCLDGNGVPRLYLQKPAAEEQAALGAANRLGKSVLDLGVMSLDGATAAALLRTFGVVPGLSGRLAWTGGMYETILSRELDLYREICCAMGSDATVEHYLRSARSSGSQWDEATLRSIYPALREIPLRVEVVPRCSFLHFGATRQLIGSGLALIERDAGALPRGSRLSLNNEIGNGGGLSGSSAWVEGCRVRAPLALGGRNVVTGVDVAEPLSLPEGACLDVIQGRGRDGSPRWFVRCYGVDDDFKDAARGGAQFCGRPLLDWIAAAGAKPEDVWDGDIPAEERNLWDAKVFPAEKVHDGYRRWLWMYRVEEATPEEKRAFLDAERYNAAEIALLSGQEAFHSRRACLRAEETRRSLRRLFGRDSAFSADDLAHSLAYAPDRAAWVSELLAEAQRYLGGGQGGDGLDDFLFCRVAHSLGTAIEQLARRENEALSEVVPALRARLKPGNAAWLGEIGLTPEDGETASGWGERLRAAAFRQLNETILKSSLACRERPRNALRSDETIWGRAPARIELGGGWTDTPPYTLEHGGHVINTAVNLNGQPPIHCYCRVVEEPVIRLCSIDGGRHIEICELDELLDYRRPGDGFALAKAALAISGFSPETASWPAGISLREMLEEFGGGIELTTLVGIPKGSGLGTSSILGAVIIAAIEKMMGRALTERELFHNVLRLEQALTTGGGWQDQIGGGAGGSKITSTERGLIPDPRIHYVADDVLDPRRNGGSTLLYYTGLTRLAKNILHQVVGGYLNRKRLIMKALEQEHQVARCIAEAMSRRDAAMFGHYVDVAWRLQKNLCGDVTNEAIESLLARVRPCVHGMRISGAGSGGFLLMICKSPRDAARVREMLEREPLNERSRFFEFEVNYRGLEVTGC